MEKAKLATVGDWEDHGHKVMQWSMFDSTPLDKAYAEGAGEDALGRAYRAQVLMLDAPKGVEDGVYDVEYFGKVFGPGHFVIGQPELEQDCQVGVTVVGGKYDAVATAEAVYRVLLQVFDLHYGSVQFDDIYIEGLDFNPQTKRFTAHIGT